MGLRDSWNELGTGGKLLVGVFVGGVVLVVGLVVLVLLAAVIGSFALGMGEEAGATAPQISFATDYDAGSETAEITHDGGDSVEAGDLRIETDDGTVAWDAGDGSVDPGDSTTVDASPGSTVSIVWSSGGESMVLSRTTVE